MIEQIQNLINNLNNLSHNQIKNDLQNILNNYQSSKTPMDNYLINFSETKEVLKQIKDVYNSDTLQLVLYNEATQSVINQIKVRPFGEGKIIHDYQILLNIFEQLNVIDPIVYKAFMLDDSLNLLSSSNIFGNLLNDDQLCKFIDEKSKIIGSKIKSVDKINLCLTDVLNYQMLDQSSRNEYQIKVKQYAEKMLDDLGYLDLKSKIIDKPISIHRIPHGFIFNVSYGCSDHDFMRRKNDKNKIAFFIDKFKTIGYNYYKNFVGLNQAEIFATNFDQIKFKFQNK